MKIATVSEIETTIIDAIVSTVNVDRSQLTPETRFDSLGASSLEMVTVTFCIEDVYDINLVKASRDTYETIGEARDVVLELLAEKERKEVRGSAA